MSSKWNECCFRQICDNTLISHKFLNICRTTWKKNWNANHTAVKIYFYFIEIDNIGENHMAIYSIVAFILLFVRIRQIIIAYEFIYILKLRNYRSKVGRTKNVEFVIMNESMFINFFIKIKTEIYRNY